MPVNVYGTIASEIYDLDKPVGALPDTGFYLGRLAGIAGALLEPACGSGRVLLPLLEAGHAVAGFDSSATMLARCSARCAAGGFAPDLSSQRFEDFEYATRFAAIVMPSASFTLIDDAATALAVLRRFHDHLQPGGLLMLDIQGLAALQPPSADRRRWHAPGGDLLTCEGVRTATDWLGQRAETLYRYERWQAHRLVDTEIDPMVQRYWGLEEFRLALAATGFGEIVVSGGYDRSRPPRTRDRILTFEARRA